MQCFVLMKNILKCEKYRPPRDKDEGCVWNLWIELEGSIVFV